MIEVKPMAWFKAKWDADKKLELGYGKICRDLRSLLYKEDAIERYHNMLAALKAVNQLFGFRDRSPKHNEDINRFGTNSQYHLERAIYFLNLHIEAFKENPDNETIF